MCGNLPKSISRIVMSLKMGNLSKGEVGFIFAYKAGWKVNTLATVSNAVLAVVLIFVGLIGYHEVISWSKVLGIAICLVGLYFINRK